MDLINMITWGTKKGKGWAENKTKQKHFLRYNEKGSGCKCQWSRICQFSTISATEFLCVSQYRRLNY